MMPSLYKKDGTTKIGELTNCIECLVEEERNGIFEVSIIYPTTDSIFNSLEEENIIVCNANDTLLNQKFRIYMTRKLMSNKIEVFARHISFDLAYDTVNSIDITNQSCEYALNTIFRQSQFSTHYKGYSDIINAQDYKISMCNCIEAIAGKEGSIIDTYGTGAEILRDNTNIHVLNKRGHDNDVTIEYAKNLTGFELEEDTTDLITRIMPYAKYNNSETNEEIMIKGNAVDSPLINNYSHPYISYIDYSDKFEEGETPTTSKLTEFAKAEYRDNKVDIPKQNYKIEFIPLSKCVGYEGLEDKISLCDTVTIKDTRYNIDTKAKVIRTVFDVLKNRYESMELGEPRTTLGDIIVGSGEDGAIGPQGPQGEQGIPGPQGPPGNDGSNGDLSDFPNTLPSTPVLSYKLYGLSNIELSWTFDNKIYYQYELYASKTKDFTPNVFDIIHAGQSSSFLFQAKPNETWYFKVCAINSHGNRTSFSTQVTVTTKKVDDLSNYVDNMAIGEALIGTLSLDRGWIGKLNANYLDVKGNFSVTDGNGKRTLDIDSFGNVNLDVASLKVNSKNVAQTEWVQSQINIVNDNINAEVEKIEKSGITNIIPYSYFRNPDIIKKYWYLNGVTWFEHNGAIGIQNNTSDDGYFISTAGFIGERIVSLYVDLDVEANTTSTVYLIGSTTNELRWDWIKTCFKYSKGECGGKKLEGIQLPSDLKTLYIQISNNNSSGNNLNNVVWPKKVNLVEGNFARTSDLTDIKQLSQLVIDTEGIRMEVSKKVDNDKVISSINQSVENIKILAKFLELTGYATFKDLASPGTTTIDGRNIKTGFIEAIQLIAPHITGKCQMYLEPGSIFSSDGEANFKKAYIMPGGELNCEGAMRAKGEIVVDNKVTARQFVNAANYPMIYTKALGYKWMVEAITLAETNSNGQMIDYAEFQTNRNVRYGVNIWYAGEGSSTFTVSDSLSGIDLINSLEYNEETSRTLNTEDTSLSYQNIPNQFCFEVNQEDGSVIRHVAPQLMLPHVTLAIQQQSEIIKRLEEKIAKLDT